MNRFDLISPRPRKDGKTYWQKIGAAFPRQNGGYSLVFDALPLPDAEGRVSVLMVEARDNNGARQDTARQAADSANSFGAGGGYGGGMEDDIPFAPEWRG